MKKIVKQDSKQQQEQQQQRNDVVNMRRMKNMIEKLDTNKQPWRQNEKDFDDVDDATNAQIAAGYKNSISVRRAQEQRSSVNQSEPLTCHYPPHITVSTTRHDYRNPMSKNVQTGPQTFTKSNSVTAPMAGVETHVLSHATKPRGKGGDEESCKDAAGKPTYFAKEDRTGKGEVVSTQRSIQGFTNLSEWESYSDPQ